MSPVEVKAKEDKEKVVAKTKGIKQQIKKEVKKDKSKNTEKFDLLKEMEIALTASPDTVDKMQALLNKFKKAEEKAPVAVASPVRRSGEH